MAKAEREGNVTTWIFVRTWSVRCDSDSSDYNRSHGRVLVCYEYQVNGKVYHKNLTYMNVGSVSPVNTTYPATIKIYYDANRLKKSVCAEEGLKHH